MHVAGGAGSDQIVVATDWHKAFVWGDFADYFGGVTGDRSGGDVSDGAGADDILVQFESTTEYVIMAGAKGDTVTDLSDGDHFSGGCYILGNKGNDEITAIGGSSRYVAGDEGIDTIEVTTEFCIIYECDGGDTIRAYGYSNHVYGDRHHPDDLWGGNTGGAGVDTIYGPINGEDIPLTYMEGEELGDKLLGGQGWNDIEGGEGDDAIIGGPDQNWLDGNNDNDMIEGGAGVDDVDGGDGRDFIHCGDGGDTADGGDGPDIVFGGDGDDNLWDYSGDYRDEVLGGAGVDTVCTWDDWLNNPTHEPDVILGEGAMQLDALANGLIFVVYVSIDGAIDNIYMDDVDKWDIWYGTEHPSEVPVIGDTP